MSRILKTNTAVRITVGPFLAITDGLTLKTGMTVTNMAMNMWHEHDDGSASTKSIDAVSFTASAGNNDMVELAGGFYECELTAAQVNFLGRARFQIYDVDLILPYFEDWLVVPGAVYDALTGGTGGMLPVDVLALSGDTTAADNAELMFDGTGYSGGAVKLDVKPVAVGGTFTSDVKTAIEASGSTLASILANTDLIPDVPATQGSLDAIALLIDAIMGGTFTNQTLVAIKAAVDGKLDEADYVAPDNTAIGQAKTAADAIQAQTDKMQFDVDNNILATADITLTEQNITDIASGVSSAVIVGLGGASITVQSPVTEAGDIEIIRGVTYTNQIVFNLTGFPSLTGYTGKLNCEECGIIDHSVTIVAGDPGAYAITVPYDGDDTAELIVGGPSGFSIKFTKTSDQTVLVAGIEGSLVVRDWAGV